MREFIEQKFKMDLQRFAEEKEQDQDTSAEDDKTVTDEEDDKTVPYDRFQEVVEEKNDLKDKVNDLSGNLNEIKEQLKEKEKEKMSEEEKLEAEKEELNQQKAELREEKLEAHKTTVIADEDNEYLNKDLANFIGVGPDLEADESKQKEAITKQAKELNKAVESIVTGTIEKMQEDGTIVDTTNNAADSTIIKKAKKAAEKHSKDQNSNGSVLQGL